MYAYSFRVGVDSKHKAPVARTTPVLREPGRIAAVTPGELRLRPLGIAGSAAVLPRPGNPQR